MAALLKSAVETGQVESGAFENDKPAVVSDLLTNLKHYCRRESIRFSDCLENSCFSFDEDVHAEKRGQ